MLALFASQSVYAEQSTKAEKEPVSKTEKEPASKTKKKPEIEVISVTGFKASLSQATNIKRFSDGVVDAISAEDIGKLPDDNVAESLQRLPGISISRDKGEGKFISVRGLSPEFSPSTLNGREIASGRTTQAAITGSGPGARAFAFNVLPSELVGGISVHKSLSADLIEGGIGGLVEINTRKPLDIEENTFLGSINAVYDDKAEQTDPKVSVFFSDKYDDDKIGFLMGISYSERTLREDQFWSWGWAGGGVDDLTTDGATIDHPDGLFSWSDAPTYVESKSDRIGVTSVFQYAPNDNFELTADLLYSDFNSSNIEDRLSIRWDFNNAFPFSAYNVEIDPATQGLVKGSTTAEGYPDRPVQMASTHEVFTLNTETVAAGMNMIWRFDLLTVEGDIGYSKATSEAENRNLRFGGDYNFEYERDPASDLPNYRVMGDLTDRSNFYFIDAFLSDTPEEDEKYSARVDFDYQLSHDYFSSIESGIRYSVNTKEQDSSSCVTCTTTLRDMNLTLADVPVVSPLSGGFFKDDNVDLPRQFIMADTLAAIGQLGLENSPFAENILDKYTIEEKTQALYFKVNYELPTDLPISGNFGVRYVKTESDATGALPSKIRIEDNAVIEQEGSFSTVGNSYSEVLPSATIKAEINDEVTIRASAAKALTRPDLDLMSPRFNFNTANPPSANTGNPELQPFSSWNYDLSAEWYFSSIGYISGALFYKDIGGFVSSTTNLNETVAGQLFSSVTRPVNASSAQIKGLELTWQQSYDFLPAPLSNLGTILNYTYIDSNSKFNSNFEPSAGQSISDFEGLSKNTYNAVMFYEDGPFRARLAYNYRSDYLENSLYIFSSRSVEGYGQLDASIGYDFDDRWSVTLEATSINNPRLRKFDAGYEALPSVLIDNGRRFILGVRAKL